MMCSLESFKKSAFVQSAAIAVICIIIYALGPISSYETNDDVYYSLIFSGKLLTTAPDPHAVVVNFVLSNFFAKLYSVIPTIPWYGVFHVVSIISSLFFLNYFFSIAHRNDRFWIRLVVSLAVALPFLYFIQFTKTSFVLAITGYLGLYLLNNSSFRSRTHSTLLHASASAFLLLSFSLRKESFFLATLLCSVLMVKALLRKKTALLASISTVILLVLAFSLAHKYNYGKEWQSFFALQKTIGPMIDYNQISYENNKEVFKGAGWSKNDFDFLKAWGHVDARIYGKDRLDQIFSRSIKAHNETMVVSTLQNAVSFPAKNYILTVSGLALLVLLIYRQEYALSCACVLLPFLLCTCFIIWQGRFPTRVSTAMIYFVPWALLIHSGSARKQLASAAITIMAVAVLAIPVYGQFKDLSSIATYRQFQNKDLHRFGALLSKTPLTVVTLGASFPYEAILPFESADYLSKAPFVWLCGMNQSPLQKKQLAENNISDIFSSLITGNSTYISLDPLSKVILQKYLMEHYQRRVTATPVYVSSSFTLYRFINMAPSL